MMASQLLNLLAEIPGDYHIIVREGTDRHKGVEWGELIHGNYTIDHEKKEVRFYSEPI